MLIQLLIIQVITFIGLIFVLRILFYRQLNLALTRLKRLHEENLAREEELKKQVGQTKQQREIELARAKEEAGQIIKEAKVKSEKINLETETQAQEEAKRILGRAKSEVEKLEAELSAGYHERAIELSTQMLKFTFTNQGKEALQHQLISEIIEEIKNLEKEKFTVKTNEVKILSAYPLTEEEKKRLAHLLSEKMAVVVELKESQDPEIIVGLIIQIGALTIDGSLRSKLKKVIPYLKGER